MNAILENDSGEQLQSNRTSQPEEDGGESGVEVQMTSLPPAQRVKRKVHRWTLVHSHFALMGGFVFDLSNTLLNEDLRAIDPQAPRQTRVFLTPAGLKEIARYEPSALLQLPEEEINDKSKANGLTKVIVCVQALWFLIHAIGRLIAGHAMALLELNTAIHAICCLGNYFAWWYKPMDIDHPFHIDLSKERFQKLCAWMIMNSDTGRLPEYYGPDASVNDEDWRDCYKLTLDYIIQYQTDHEQKDIEVFYSNKCKTHNPNDMTPPDIKIQPDRMDDLLATNRDFNVKMYPLQAIYGYRLNAKCVETPPEGSETPFTTLSRSEIQCLRLAQAFQMENSLLASSSESMSAFSFLSSL